MLQTEELTNVDIANINAPTQIVISGLVPDMQRAVDQLQKLRKARVILLQVNGPLHSRYLQSVAEKFADYVKTINFASAKIPVIANVTAKPYGVEQTADLLIAQIVKPVQWEASINYFLVNGVQEFIEIGPGQVSTNLVKRIRRHFNK